MLISEKLLSMLAQAISQKAKSFIHYWELSQHIPNNTNFQQIMIEIILREQKHFEVLNEIISQLIKDKESDSLLEPFARSVKNGNKNDANDKEEINKIIYTPFYFGIAYQFDNLDKDLYDNISYYHNQGSYAFPLLSALFCTPQ